MKLEDYGYMIDGGLTNESKLVMSSMFGLEDSIKINNKCVCVFVEAIKQMNENVGRQSSCKQRTGDDVQIMLS